MKFYSEKYMNFVSQPIASNSTEQKISNMFSDNLFEKVKMREEETKLPEDNVPFQIFNTQEKEETSSPSKI